MSQKKTQQVDVSSDSEMPPIKKTDFYALIKNKDDVIEQKIKQIIKVKGHREILEEKLKDMEELYDKEIKQKELLQKQIENNNSKKSQKSLDISQFMQKSKEKLDYLEKNERKLIDEEIEKNHKTDLEQFRKKYNIKK